jgi:hypothetical protein
MRPLSVSSSQNVLGIALHTVLLTSLTLRITLCVKCREQVRRGICKVFVPCPRCSDEFFELANEAQNAEGAENRLDKHAVCRV